MIPKSLIPINQYRYHHKTNNRYTPRYVWYVMWVWCGVNVYPNLIADISLDSCFSLSQTCLPCQPWLHWTFCSTSWISKTGSCLIYPALHLLETGTSTNSHHLILAMIVIEFLRIELKLISMCRQLIRHKISPALLQTDIT